MSDSYQAALAFLYGRIDYERAVAMPYGSGELKLDRMRDLLARLDNPQDGLPIVHVAGTKGKGSTSAMIASVLSAAGHSTGLFTSPHLERLEERFRIDGRPCSEDELAVLVDRLRPVVAEMDREAEAPGDAGPTYFELTTAVGLLHFAERRVAAAVLEVGLGGRLDSTNVCMPRVTVITSISFDHMKQLGNTLEAIAREKAGIVKRGVPLVSGVTTEGPRLAIEEICRAQSAPLVQLGRDFDYVYRAASSVDESPARSTIDFVCRTQGREQFERDVQVGLLGEHQGANAAVTLAVVDQLRDQGWSIAESACRCGLADVNWPARVEVIARRPTIILDSAHNVASIAALVQTISESFAVRERLLIFATTQEKQIAEMLAALLPQFDRVIFTRYQNNPRGVPPDDLASFAREVSDLPIDVCPDPPAAWRRAQDLIAEDDLLCITGSFFIAAEMRNQIMTHPLSLLSHRIGARRRLIL
ncbi:MAG TPA: folylpolyglutamate synthase/dihydrofolate synthase family protein [Pirellulales bacterium]|nr:folylpolyglutamate synthase/dihydrofolate synthase family protein [Pirellulales bacterium]